MFDIGYGHYSLLAAKYIFNVLSSLLHFIFSEIDSIDYILKVASQEKIIRSSVHEIAYGFGGASPKNVSPH